MTHLAPHTSSTIISKSVARGGGRTSYRGLVRVNPNAHHSRSTVKCDALLVDTISRSDTYPYVDVRTDDVSMGHEATVSKVSDDQLFYLMSRGLTEDEAMAMVVRGFVEPIARELPMEYALELNRLIELQMEGARRMTAGSCRSGSRAEGREGGAGRDRRSPRRASGSPPTTSRRSRSRAAARRTGGSPRCAGCAGCTTAPRRSTARRSSRSPGPARASPSSGSTRDDPRVGEGGVPADRVAAQAWSAAPDVTIVTLDGTPRAAHRHRHRPGRGRLGRRAPAAAHPAARRGDGRAHPRRVGRARRQPRGRAGRRVAADAGRHRRVGGRRRARRRPAPGAGPRRHAEGDLGGAGRRPRADQPDGRVPRAGRRRRAGRARLRRRRASTSSSGCWSTTRCRTAGRTCSTRTRCRATARTPSGSATC